MRLMPTARRFDWRYALGEVSLIVMGVTIALAASSWYEERIDRQTEAEYVDRLRTALAMDTLRFADYATILEIKASTLKSLLAESATSLLAGGNDRLMRDLDYSEYQALPEANSATFEELKSTGRLALIRDAGLHDALSQYYAGYETVRRDVRLEEQRQTG